MSKRIYTYPYDQTYQPAMPMVEVGVQLPENSTVEVELTLLIDSGSDGTLVPIDILEEIGSRYVDQVRIRSILGDTELADRYLVNLRVGSHLIRAVRVVAINAHDEPILGRNVLNQLSITLNGLAGVTEIPE
ncbi:aspartyl protease family protein [Anaerolineales bacterium HSG6]|nr:aspartyl protease family protein [Anaerolineales bacterium HSG6]